MVKPLGASDNRLTPQKKQEILNNTTVSIVFETRSSSVDGAAPDVNKRILVVPSDETLRLKEAELQAGNAGAGFRPPLSYPLDRNLMLAWLEDTIVDICNGLPTQTTLTPEIKAAFKAHVSAEIKRRTRVVNGQGAPADSVLNDILNSPVRAFHRSVGIYATNMCR